MQEVNLIEISKHVYEKALHQTEEILDQNISIKCVYKCITFNRMIIFPLTHYLI